MGEQSYAENPRRRERALKGKSWGHKNLGAGSQAQKKLADWPSINSQIHSFDHTQFD